MVQKARVGEVIIAESATTQRLDGYVYFPPETVRWDLLEDSPRTSVCHWKGVASYYDVVLDGERLPAAAWTYRSPSPAAEGIRGHVAFWHGVKVEKVST
ncbi:MAG: DUF427 domain-containing protein [Actinobacteria bacterium]|nr:DUF427 domain-containing protein [Actinomycetota bacterium]